MVTVLLCLGIFLFPLPAPGSEVPPALVMADSPRVDQGESWNDSPLDGSYLVVSAEEAEGEDKDPINADLLTMLLLMTSSFGVTVGWLLTNAQRQGALCSLGVVRPRLATACEDLPFLGVFRL